MTKQEFLEELRRMLARELDDAEVADNVRYYSSYIDDAVRGGKSEAQVLSELGDPRMIARTILDVDEQKEGIASPWKETTVYTETEDGAYDAEEGYGGYDGYGGSRPGGFHVFLSGWKAWLLLLLVLIVLFLILGTIFVIFWQLLPVILVVWGAVMVYRWLRWR